MTAPTPSYLATVIALYLDMPDTPLRAGPHDHRFAHCLLNQAVAARGG